MALIKWDPFVDPSNSLREQINSLFNNAYSGSFGSARSMAFAPAVDVYSSDKELTIEAHLPNFKEDEVSVQHDQGDLEIKAEHIEKEEDKKRKYLVRESVSQYYRRFTLPQNSDSEKIEARFENGVLRVTVPFKKLPEPKRIAIKAKNK